MPVLIIIVLTSATPAQAHDGTQHGTAYPWTFDPWIVAPLLAAAFLYIIGIAALARRSTSRNSLWLRAVCYGFAMATLAASLVSPLHFLGERLFTFHMIEHEIVMAVSAPALVLARPVGVLLWGLPAASRSLAGAAMQMPVLRRTWDRLAGGASATILHGLAIWLWHVPGLFEAAVTHTPIHRFQHLSFLATAILFWWAVIWRSDRGAAAWHLFVTMIHTSVLGALMALSPRVLYVVQTGAAADWGLTPLEDQQLAGMIMWIPAGIIYAGAALAMLLLWIRGSGDRRAQDV